MAVGERASRSGSDAIRFEPSRNVLVAAHDEIAILELAGVFHASSKRSAGRPRLVVTTPDGSAEFKAVEAHTAHAGPDPSTWTAAFAVPRTLTDDDSARFALAVGRSATLDLPDPARDTAPLDPHPRDEVEGQTWGSLVVDLSEARRELEETQARLVETEAELARVRADAEQAAEREPAPARPQATWLDEIEAEETPQDLASPARNGSHPDTPRDEDDDDAEDVDPLPAPRRVAPPATAEHEAVYEATLKRMQVERRAKLRRRRILGRLLALVVFLIAAAAIYIIIEGAVGVDLVGIF